MRALLPRPADDVDLPSVYAYPDGRPWLRANMVTSLDGAVSVAGRSSGLSGAGDRQVFALLRDLCDAVLVGAGTVRAEGYEAVKRSEARVDARRARGLTDVPAVAVVTSSLALDPASALFAGTLVPTVVVTTERAAAARGAPFAEVADVVTTPGDRVDVAAAVAALHRRGLTRLLCEGGPELLAQVVAADRLDELCLTLAPRLVAGEAGRALTGPPLEPVSELRLASLLEDDGFLLGRWVREGSAAGQYRAAP